VHFLCVHILTTLTDLILRRGGIGVSIIEIVTPDVIRGPERQARLMRVALDTRLRGHDGEGVVLAERAPFETLRSSG
jgi:hypothetical protein